MEFGENLTAISSVIAKQNGSHFKTGGCDLGSTLMTAIAPKKCSEKSEKNPADCPNIHN